MSKLSIYYKFPTDCLVQVRQLAPDFDVVVCGDKDELQIHLENTEILFTMFHPIDAGILRRAPQLKWIQALTAGIDPLPLEEIKSRGILLTSGRGIHKIHMAEYAVAAMIILTRNFHGMFCNQVQGRWERSLPQGEIHGRVAGIVGLGSIGREIARKANLLGMHVIGVQRDPQPLPFVEHVYTPTEMDEVFKRSDYVINLLPATVETRGLISENYFNLMKPTACFINMGRGPTVNQADLITALQNHKIRGLFSDVFETEPLPAESPLWKMENVIITPHIAGVSAKYIDRAMDIIRHNLGVYVSGAGEMMNLVDLNKGY